MLCEIAQVSRSGYYNWVNSENIRIEKEEKDKKDFEVILQAYRYRGYDKRARRIYMWLIHLDPPVIMNIKKIRRLMKKYNLFLFKPTASDLHKEHYMKLALLMN